MIHFKPTAQRKPGTPIKSSRRLQDRSIQVQFVIVYDNQGEYFRELYKGKDEFKKGYQPRAYVIQKDGGTNAADITRILSNQEHLYKKLLKVHQISSLEGSEIYTVESQSLVFQNQKSLQTNYKKERKKERKEKYTNTTLPEQINFYQNYFKHVEVNHTERYTNSCTHLEKGRIATRMERIHYCSNSREKR